MSVSPFLDPFADIDRHGEELPHWRQGAALCFVTWHLADALPQAVLDELATKKECWLAAHVPVSGGKGGSGIGATREQGHSCPYGDTERGQECPRSQTGGRSAPSPRQGTGVSPLPDDAIHRLSPEDAAEYHRLFTAEYEATLDADHGSCLLRDPRLALQVEVALLHDDGVRYDLIAYAIMPNHVHVLVSLKPNASLERIIKAWKGVSARTINKLTEQSGPLWQANYWDRLIRNRKHFEHVRDYILNNPIRAHLSTGTFIVRELRTVSDTGELIIFRGKDTPVLDATREQGHSCPCSEPERGQECPHSHAGDKSVPSPIRGQECPRSHPGTGVSPLPTANPVFRRRCRRHRAQSQCPGRGQAPHGLPRSARAESLLHVQRLPADAARAGRLLRQFGA
jgi:REP element-mobilizing transposase RayT